VGDSRNIRQNYPAETTTYLQNSSFRPPLKILRYSAEPSMLQRWQTVLKVRSWPGAVYQQRTAVDRYRSFGTGRYTS